ncbi:MAG: nucleoside recognition domain-containing protein [Clostridia bacterium]
MMGRIWAGMVCISVVCSIYTGKTAELASAAMDGARASIDLCLAIGGMILLWSGVMEIMRRSGLMAKLSKLLAPLICILFPKSRHESAVIEDISANVSANLLGLGNAATPAGIRATRSLHRLSGSKIASDDLCMLVVINTASLQLIPTTIGAVRASCGAANPFDIIPAVWVASIISLACGIAAAKLLRRLYR